MKILLFVRCFEFVVPSVVMAEEMTLLTNGRRHLDALGGLRWCRQYFLSQGW